MSIIHLALFAISFAGSLYLFDRVIRAPWMRSWNWKSICVFPIFLLLFLFVLINAVMIRP